jgi:hypothetical protein
VKIDARRAELEAGPKDVSHDPWKRVNTTPGMCPYQRADGTPCNSKERCEYHLTTARKMGILCKGHTDGVLFGVKMPCFWHHGSSYVQRNFTGVLCAGD